MLDHLLGDWEQKVQLQHHERGILVQQQRQMDQSLHMGRPASGFVVTEHIAHEHAENRVFCDRVNIPPQR